MTKRGKPGRDRAVVVHYSAVGRGGGRSGRDEPREAGKRMGTVFASVLEERIRQAQAAGVFDDLPGAGKPLVFDEDPLAPEELRVAWRLLRGAGLVGPGTAYEGPMPGTFAAMMALIDRADPRRDPYGVRAHRARLRAREDGERRARIAASVLAARQRKGAGS